MDPLQILIHPLTSLVLCISFGAVAVSGKFSHRAAHLLLVAAWGVGSFGILRSDLPDWRGKAVGAGVLSVVILGTAFWVRPSKNRAVAVSQAPPMPDLQGRIIRVSRDQDQQCYYLEIGVVNHSAVSCTVAEYILNVSGRNAVFGKTNLRGTMEEYIPVGEYSISHPRFLVHPLTIDENHPLQRGVEQIGWVEFYEESLYVRSEDLREESFALAVIDSLGNKHQWGETRFTAQRARFHRGLKEDLDKLHL